MTERVIGPQEEILVIIVPPSQGLKSFPHLYSRRAGTKALILIVSNTRLTYARESTNG